MTCSTAARRVASNRECLLAQVLHTPTITFEIQQLVLNSTSKLLAVVGAHSVVVVVLPRRGWSTAVGKTIECRSVLCERLPGFSLLRALSHNNKEITWREARGS
jgi:hypothetical protein